MVRILFGEVRDANEPSETRTNSACTQDIPAKLLSHFTGETGSGKLETRNKFSKAFPSEIMKMSLDVYWTDTIQPQNKQFKHLPF